jgi:hypothetical protein
MPRQWAWIPAAAQLPVGLPRSVFKGGAENNADRTPPEPTQSAETIFPGETPSNVFDVWPPTPT